jgi:hypothetical protein
MTINEQFKNLTKSHIDEDDIIEFFICTKDWANTNEGSLLDQCIVNDFDYYTDAYDYFFEKYGELKSIDWCVLLSEYGGLGVGFVVKEAR